MSRLAGRVDDIDVQMDKIQRLIEGGARLGDAELGAGLATTESLTSIERKLDHAAAACEALHRHERELRAQR